MHIIITRPPIEDKPFTISSLILEGDTFTCDTMEDRDRGLYQTDDLAYIAKVKVKHETAIPYGKYEVTMSYSERFKKFLPLILNVPGYDGIRFHPGNKETDSSGCILPGIRSGNTVVRSVDTTSKLIAMIAKAIKTEKVYVSILPTLLQ